MGRVKNAMARRSMGLKLRIMTALPLVALAVAVLASSAPAGAAQHQTAMKANSARSANRAVATSASDFCGFITDPIYTVSPSPAVQLDPFNHQVIGTAGINVLYRVNCSAQVIFKLETKVCGFWGCNSREIASSKVIVFPGPGPISSRLTAHCRPGTNSYQMVYRVNWTDFTGDSLEGHVDENASNWVKGSC
jgi:hypothetical protein